MGYLLSSIFVHVPLPFFISSQPWEHPAVHDLDLGMAFYNVCLHAHDKRYEKVL